MTILNRNHNYHLCVRLLRFPALGFGNRYQGKHMTQNNIRNKDVVNSQPMLCVHLGTKLRRARRNRGRICLGWSDYTQSPADWRGDTWITNQRAFVIRSSRFCKTPAASQDTSGTLLGTGEEKRNFRNSTQVTGRAKSSWKMRERGWIAKSESGLCFFRVRPARYALLGCARTWRETARMRGKTAPRNANQKTDTKDRGNWSHVPSPRARRFLSPKHVLQKERIGNSLYSATLCSQ